MENQTNNSPLHNHISNGNEIRRINARLANIEEKLDNQTSCIQELRIETALLKARQNVIKVTLFVLPPLIVALITTYHFLLTLMEK